MTDPVQARDALDDRIDSACELLRTLALLAELQLARAARLRRCHERQRCIDSQDLLRSVEALCAAQKTLRQASEQGRHVAKLLDHRRGDGLATVEYEVLQALREARLDVSGDDTP